MGLRDMMNERVQQLSRVIHKKVEIDKDSVREHLADYQRIIAY